MLNYIKTGERFILDTTLPGFQVLGKVRDYLHYLNTVKSRQISNNLTYGFLSKSKNSFNFATDQ